METLVFFRAMFVIGAVALIGLLSCLLMSAFLSRCLDWYQRKKNSKRSQLSSDALEYLPVNDDPVVLAKIREGDQFARTVEKYVAEYVENNYSDEDFDLSFSKKNV